MPMQRKDFLGVTDMYLDTAAYNLDPSFNYYLQDPRELDQRRLRAYKYYMDFYDGKHWDDVIGSVTMSEWNPAYGYYYSWNEDFNRRTWNISRNIIDKIVDWICQEEWKNKIPPELAPKPKMSDMTLPGMAGQGGDSGGGGGGTSPQQSQSSQKSFSNNQGQGNNGQKPQNSQQGGNSQQGQQQGQQGSPQAGQMADEMNSYWDQHQKDDEDSAQTILDNVWIANERHTFTYDLVYQACIVGDAFVRMSWDDDFYAPGVGELKLQVLDSRTVIPYWDGQNKRKMIGCRIQYPVREVQEDGGVKMRMYQEVHTEATILELLDGEVINQYPNPLGELMIVHFPNEPLPYRKYGRSDLENLLLSNKEYNERSSDLSEILAYHAAPITVIKGARVQNLEKGARKIWGGIPKDGDVFNLELQSDLSATQEYLDSIKKHLHESGNVPEEALGALQEVSNTSAAALHVQYQPLIERVKKKQMLFGKGLRTLNRLILMFYQMAEVWKPPEGIAPSRMYRTEIEWGDALPRDRSLDLADIATEIGLGIESKKGALVRLGIEDPEAKLMEIEEELKHDAQLQFMTAGMMGDDDNTTGEEGGTEPGAEDGPQNDVSGAVNASKTNSTSQGSNIASQAVKKAAQISSGNN